MAETRVLLRVIGGPFDGKEAMVTVGKTEGITVPVRGLDGVVMQYVYEIRNGRLVPEGSLL